MAVEELAQILLRRNTETNLPGAPTSLDPIVLTTGLAPGELFFATDTGRLFLGDTPLQGQTNYQRVTLPYQNIEVLTENSTEFIRTFMLSATRDFGSEGFYSATLQPSADIGPVLIDVSIGGTAPYNVFGVKTHVKMDYFIFADDGTPLLQGQLFAATMYAADQAYVVQNTTLSSPAIGPLNNDYGVMFELVKISINGAFSHSLQYTSSFPDPVKLLFSVKQPGNLFVPEIGFVADAFLANGTNLGADIRFDGLSATLVAASNATASSATVGIIGPTGPAGVAGAAGLTGGFGPTGPRGFAGLNGSIGPTGATGAIGATGSIGPTGSAGPTGAEGVPGATGPRGFDGQPGAAGVVGPTGQQGLAGYQGDRGPTGAAGSPGGIGPTGAAGIPGATGPTGPMGVKGDYGPTGSQGGIGATGATGMIGPTGVGGPTGATGPTGPGASYVVVRQNYIANNGDLLLVDTSGGPILILLPNAPMTGMSVQFRERRQSWGTNALTINPGPRPIEGVNGPYVCSGTTPDNFDLVYVADTYGWSMVSY